MTTNVQQDEEITKKIHFSDLMGLWSLVRGLLDAVCREPSQQRIQPIE